MRNMVCWHLYNFLSYLKNCVHSSGCSQKLTLFLLCVCSTDMQQSKEDVKYSLYNWSKLKVILEYSNDK